MTDVWEAKFYQERKPWDRLVGKYESKIGVDESDFRDQCDVVMDMLEAQYYEVYHGVYDPLNPDAIV